MNVPLHNSHPSHDCSIELVALRDLTYPRGLLGIPWGIILHGGIARHACIFCIGHWSDLRRQ